MIVIHPSETSMANETAGPLMTSRNQKLHLSSTSQGAFGNARKRSLVQPARTIRRAISWRTDTPAGRTRWSSSQTSPSNRAATSSGTPELALDDRVPSDASASPPELAALVPSPALGNTSSDAPLDASA